MTEPAEPARSFSRTFAGPVDWNAHAHRGALALPSNDVDFPVKHRGPFPHAEQSERSGARKLAPRQAATVVLHFEDKFVAFFLQVNVHLGRVRVADDVGERLLKDAKNRRRPVRVQVQLLEAGLETAVDSGSFFKLLDLP